MGEEGKMDLEWLKCEMKWIWIGKKLNDPRKGKKEETQQER